MMNDNLKALTEQKAAIEKEMATLKQQVKIAEETENYDQGLVDREGFPRPDLDYGKLVEYKTNKKRINELQNDYTKLMVDLEKELHALHQHYAESGQAQKDIDEYEARIDQERLEKKQKEIDEMNRLLKEKAANIAAQKAVPIPFCEITVVIEHSPAYNGGLRTNDMVVNFGTINTSNFSEINQVVEVVRNNINQAIPVRVLREVHPTEMKEEENDHHTYRGIVYRLIETTITPQKWEGEGVLGARFALIL